MQAWAGVAAALLLSTPVAGFERVEGGWDLTLQLFPTTKLYSSELQLSFTVAGWELESESKLYSDGLRYQNFYLSGYLGDWDVWGKMYFHAQDVRYQKAWLNVAAELWRTELTVSFNHWASEDDYWSSDEDRFGPWPCNVVNWDMLLPWDQSHEDQYKYRYLHVQGPVVSYYPNNPTTYVTLNVGAPWPNDRFMVYITGDAFTALKARLGNTFWEDLVGKTICVYGKIIEYSDLPEIKLDDAWEADDLSLGECCGTPGALGPLVMLQGQLSWDTFAITADFADCCTGISFRKLEVTLSGLPLCCGATYDAALTFSKCQGFQGIKFSLYDLGHLCCGISLDLAVEFTVDSKSVSIFPSWEGISGCFELYGDVDWNGFNAIEGLEIWGWGIYCYIEPISLTIITALNPDRVEDVVDISFYTDEWEYLGLEYVGPGCCGDITFTVELWFGDDGLLLGILRTKYYLELPLSDAASVFVKGQWDFSDHDPLDYLDVGWGISF